MFVYVGWFVLQCHPLQFRKMNYVYNNGSCYLLNVKYKFHSSHRTVGVSHVRKEEGHLDSQSSALADPLFLNAEVIEQVHCVLFSLSNPVGIF